MRVEIEERRKEKARMIFREKKRFRIFSFSISFASSSHLFVFQMMKNLSFTSYFFFFFHLLLIFCDLFPLKLGPPMAQSTPWFSTRLCLKYCFFFYEILLGMNRERYFHLKSKTISLIFERKSFFLWWVNRHSRLFSSRIFYSSRFHLYLFLLRLESK